MIRRFSFVTGVFLSAATLAFGQTNEAGNPGAATPPAAGAATSSPTPSTPPKPRNFRAERYVGTLVKVDGTNLIIKAHEPQGQIKQVTVPTDAQTEYRINNKIGGLQDLKPDMLLRVTRLSVGGTAGKLRIMARDFGLNGTVLKVSGTNVFMKMPLPGGEPREIKVPTDDNTQVVILTADPKGGAPDSSFGKLDDLKPGTRVNVNPARGTAMRITISEKSAASTGTDTNSPSAGTNSPPAQ